MPSAWCCACPASVLHCHLAALSQSFIATNLHCHYDALSLHCIVTVALFPCCTVTVLHWDLAALSLGCTVTVLHRHYIALSCIVSMLHCHHPTLSPCCSFTALHCHHIALSPAQQHQVPPAAAHPHPRGHTLGRTCYGMTAQPDREGSSTGAGDALQRKLRLELWEQSVASKLSISEAILHLYTKCI